MLLFSPILLGKLCAQATGGASTSGAPKGAAVEAATEKSSAAPAAEQAPNIVPNPGFEQFISQPIGWYYKGSHFGEVVKYWQSATTASPDAYSPKVRVPESWQEKGFGKFKPHSGKNMAGITLYGCKNGKPHCREYIEILLAEPLVAGQSYLVEFWVASLPKALQINHLGAVFTLDKIDKKTDEQLQMAPQVAAEEVVEAPAKWVKISGKFIAEEEADWLTIGNFSSDEQTKTENVAGDASLNFAYYYIDDVLVKKIPPFRPLLVGPDDLTKITLRQGDTVRLKNIYFEFDRSELMPRSFVELGKLAKILRENPTMQIEVIGHTDSDGSDDYNQKLSESRARTVVAWLRKQGIRAERLRSRGAGERQPVSTNETDAGRQQNRRVEFVVLRR